MNAIQLLNTEESSRGEWLAARKLGSSDAAAALGLSPWRSPYSVWAEKVGLAEPVEENESMTWGKLLEPVIAQEFSRRTGLTIERNTSLLAHPDHTWMTATVDYWVEEAGKRGILEIKNTGFFNGADWDGAVPDTAHTQVAHQLAVSGVSFAYVAALIGGNRLVWMRIERDNDLITAITHREREFWRLVENKTPPPLRSSDSALMNDLYPQSEALEIALPDCLGRVEELMDIKAKIKKLEESAEVIEASVKEIMQSAERAKVGAFNVSWKTASRSSVDTKALKAAHPTIAAQFEKSTTYRTFKITEAKANGN